MVFVFRGTEKTSLQDINNDRVMWYKKEIPAQFYDALKLYDKLQESPAFKDKTPICTGHSLGGSIADFVVSKRGDKSVVFSPYAIGDLVKNPVEGTDITNYGNPNDPVFMENFKNHIGKIKYVFNSKNFSEEYKYSSNDSLKRKIELAVRHFHSIENMGDIDMATDDITGQKFLKSLKDKFSNNTDETVKRIYKGTENYLDTRNYSNDASCPGYYPVSGYTRDNGTKVDSYIRNCYLHGN